MKRNRPAEAASGGDELSALLSPELQAQLGMSDGRNGGGGGALILPSRKKKQKLTVGAAAARGTERRKQTTAALPQSRNSRRAEKSKTRKLASLQVCSRANALRPGVPRDTLLTYLYLRTLAPCL